MNYLHGLIERRGAHGLWMRGPDAYPYTIIEDTRQADARTAVIIANHESDPWTDDLTASINRLDDALEVIVVDDASSDRSLERIASTTTHPILAVRLATNTGNHARPLNLGVMLSRAPHTTFIDADDAVLGNGTVSSREILARTPSASGTVSNLLVHVEPGARLPWTDDLERVGNDVYLRRARTYAFDDLTEYARAIGLRGFRRETIMRAGGWEESLKGQADYGLLLKVARAGPIVPDHHTYYLYRIHGQNMSFSENASMREKQAFLTQLRGCAPQRAHSKQR